MIEKLQKAFFAAGEADAALIFSQENRLYLTGFPSSAGVLLLTAQQAFLLLDFRYAEAARRRVKGCEVVLFANFSQVLGELLRAHAVRCVAVEFERLTLAQAERFRTICREAHAETREDRQLDRAIAALRVVKTAGEIELIRAAQAITDRAFTQILPEIRPGVTEREIALELEFFMRRDGADGMAFEPIVVSGTNGSLCHGVPSEKKIAPGEFVTMDFGARRAGYCSDMTRTVGVGRLKAEQKEAYEIVLQAQAAAIAAIRAGVPCAAVDRAARERVEARYPGAFEHATGHGVGIEIHEAPQFSKTSVETARGGMVVSVEPGVYLEGRFGLRIEDLIAVTENGCENLTHAPKELIVL